MNGKACLDFSVFRCPQCGHYYANASRYAAELEADIGCGRRHGVFKIKKRLTDRVMLEFQIDDREKVLEAEVTEQYSWQGMEIKL